MLIHIGIIVFYKIFRIKPPERRSARALTGGQLALSGVIVVVTSSLMLMIGALLIYSSVEEKHSTVHLVENTAQWLSIQGEKIQATVVASSALRTPAAQAMPGLIVLLGMLFSLPWIPLLRNSFNASQSGHSVISVTLLVSGLIAFLTGATYIVLYILITSSVGF